MICAENARTFNKKELVENENIGTFCWNKINWAGV